MPSSRPPAKLVGRWLLAAVVPASALLIGSLHAPVLIAMTILAAASAALLWIEPARRVSRASRYILLAITLLFVATALQSIPLPAGLVALIAPNNADTWARALSPFREAGPAWHPLSVAPPASHVDLLRGVFYACTFLAALRIALEERGSRFLEAIVIASAVLVALTTLAHTAVRAETVFGVYHPRDAQGYLPGRIGPLLNPNHVAAYANVGALVALGVALTERGSASRILAAGASVLLAGTSVWAASRGGTATLVIGAVVIGVLTVYRARRGRRAAYAEVVAVTGALVAAGVLLAISSSDVARQDLAGRDLSKLAIVKTSLELVPKFPVFGTGKGSFETVFPLVREGTAYFTFLRPENIVAQWTIEWGVPVATAAFALLAIGLRPRVVVGSERPRVGSWVALLVVVFHDLVDFHLEVPAVVALAATCAAAVVGRRALDTEPRKPSLTSRFPRTMAFAFAGAAIACAMIVLPNVNHSLADDRDRAAKLALDRGVSSAPFETELRAMMLRYPAEPFFPLAGAVRAQATKEGSVVPWIARALERYPTFGRAHLVLARNLAPRHRAQARLEYRLAYTYDEQLRGAVVNEAPFLVDDADSALELVPDVPGGTQLLEALAETLTSRLPSTALKLDAELLRREPGATGPLRRAIRAATSDLSNAHPWCSEPLSCSADGRHAADELARRFPEKCESHLLLARLEIAAGRTREGLDGLNAAIDTMNDRATCLRALVTLATEAGDRRRADAALERATRAGCGTREECIDLYVWAASVDVSRGNNVRALSFYKRAADLAPENDENLIHVAQLAESSGLTSEAIDAYRKLAVRHPDNGDYLAKGAALRAKAADDRSRIPR